MAVWYHRNEDLLRRPHAYGLSLWIFTSAGSSWERQLTNGSSRDAVLENVGSRGEESGAERGESKNN
jgi:hypothetical protein